MSGSQDSPSPVCPGSPGLWLTSAFDPLARSYTNTSRSPFVSLPATRSVAKLANTTKRPSALITPPSVKSAAVAVGLSWRCDTRVEPPVSRSYT